MAVTIDDFSIECKAQDVWRVGITKQGIFYLVKDFLTQEEAQNFIDNEVDVNEIESFGEGS